MDALKSAITNGLWCKTPRVPDRLGDKTTAKHFEVSRPITCFTEWPLVESRPHTTRYGRLGLGFPRRFVFDRGGHPVIYVKGILSGDQYTKNFLTLKEFLADDRLADIFGENQIKDHQKRLDYVTHFAKWSCMPRSKAPKGTTKTSSSPRKSVMLVSGVDEKNFERRYGKRQELLEEREWRVVFHPTFKRYFQKPISGRNKPDYYMPFDVGDDLFTVVLPDNRTMNMVMNNKFFVEKFYPKDGLHTTILSLDDIDTFD